MISIFSYDASFDSFDKGVYGIGFLSNQSSGTSGFGATMSFHTNIGIISARKAQTTFKLGPTYDYVVAPNIMLSAILRGLVGSYNKATEDGKTKEKWRVGVTLTPSIRFKLNKVILGMGYELGWAQKQKKMLHNASITLGIYVK